MSASQWIDPSRRAMRTNNRLLLQRGPTAVSAAIRRLPEQEPAKMVSQSVSREKGHCHVLFPSSSSFLTQFYVFIVVVVGGWLDEMEPKVCIAIHKKNAPSSMRVCVCLCCHHNHRRHYSTE